MEKRGLGSAAPAKAASGSMGAILPLSAEGGRVVIVVIPKNLRWTFSHTERASGLLLSVLRMWRRVLRRIGAVRVRVRTRWHAKARAPWIPLLTQSPHPLLDVRRPRGHSR
jgi:hypothetical protein